MDGLAVSKLNLTEDRGTNKMDNRYLIIKEEVLGNILKSKRMREGLLPLLSYINRDKLITDYKELKKVFKYKTISGVWKLIDMYKNIGLIKQIKNWDGSFWIEFKSEVEL